MRKVKFTVNAEESFEKVLAYLEGKWSVNRKNDFLKKSHKAISTIILHPESFPISDKNRMIRKCVITK